MLVVKKPMFDDNLMEKLTQEFLNHEMPNLTVLGSERVKGKPLNFILSCDKCSQDEELWPYGSIKSTRGNLIKRQVPCGGTNRRSMTRNQYEILINRKADTLGYKFVGFKGGWCGGSTQLELYNESTNNYWDVPKITDFLRDGRMDPEERKVNTSNRMVVEDTIHIENFMSTGKFLDGTQFWRSSKENIKGYKTYWNYTCPVCSNDEYVKAGICSGVFETLTNSLKKGVVGCRCSKVYRWTQNQREYQISRICSEEGLIFVGWGTEKGYINEHSKFKWLCSKGHDCSTDTKNFLKGARCKTCKKVSQKLRGVINGYFPLRKNEKDFLYILNFNDKYIKVGRSFVVEDRIKELYRTSKTDNISKLKILTSNHQTVYDTEQWLHEELRERGFEYNESDGLWSRELFTLDCIYALNYLLESTYLEDVSKEYI